MEEEAWGDGAWSVGARASAWAEAGGEEGRLVEWSREGEVVAGRDWTEGVGASAWAEWEEAWALGGWGWAAWVEGRGCICKGMKRGLGG